jgi:hypothetical protein
MIMSIRTVIDDERLLLGLIFQHQLHEDQVEPSIELSADRPEMTDLREAKPRMQPQRRLVGCLYARDHDMFDHCAGARDQSHHQVVADAKLSGRAIN